MSAPVRRKRSGGKADEIRAESDAAFDRKVNGYVCIECGKEATELYKIYSGGIIKIAHCEYCMKVVDKYVEFDPVIILLDALLFKPQAYRHILFNTNSNIHWKLSILCLLCDAYTKWAQRSTVSPPKDPLDRQFLFFALQWHFYVMFLVAGLELSVFLTGVVVSALLCTTKTDTCNANDRCSLLLLRSLLLCCVGKLLIIPAIIWGQTDITTCMWLTRLFMFTAATKTLRVLLKSSMVQASCLVLLGFAAQYLSTYLSPHLEWVLTEGFAS